MNKYIELEFTDDQIANYPSYRWPLQCYWCGCSHGAQIRAPEVDGIKFSCQVCGKPNIVHRQGNIVRISPASGSPVGCLVIIVAIIGALVFWGPIKLPSIHLPSITIPAGATSKMATLVEWIGYIAGVATLIHLPIQISRWRAVYRLYGRIPWSLIRQIRVYSSKNRMLRIQSGLLLVMLMIGVVPIIIHFLGGDILEILRPLDAFARSQRIPVLLISAWQLNRVVGYLLPPACLLLGTAKSVNVHLVAVLSRSLRPYRVLSLLDLKEHIFPPFVFDVMFNNLRTVNGHEWRTVVHHLMDVVPLIIVDTAVRTESVNAEMHRIERFGYEYKVVPFSTAKYGNEINALESGIGAVIGAAQRLGDELTPQILKLLKQPTDIARRWSAQQNYNAMIKSVPRPVRFNSNINGMLIKAHFILAWTMENYLRDCKNNVPVGQSFQLIEDIPSCVTPAEEMAYLRQSRGLDEVRGIVSSALDLAFMTPGPQQTFNIANAHTKIGKCARFSRDWDAALEHLGKAIEMLSQMTNGIIAPPIDLRQIHMELADAYFLRGEVYMARYRQTASNFDHDNAESNFHASILLDKELGQDSSETVNRIHDLNCRL